MIRWTRAQLSGPNVSRCLSVEKPDLNTHGLVAAHDAAFKSVARKRPGAGLVCVDRRSLSHRCGLHRNEGQTVPGCKFTPQPVVEGVRHRPLGRIIAKGLKRDDHQGETRLRRALVRSDELPAAERANCDDHGHRCQRDQADADPAKKRHAPNEPAHEQEGTQIRQREHEPERGRDASGQSKPPEEVSLKAVLPISTSCSNLYASVEPPLRWRRLPWV